MPENFCKKCGCKLNSTEEEICFKCWLEEKKR